MPEVVQPELKELPELASRSASLCLFPGRACSLRSHHAGREALQIDSLRDDVTHLFLQLVHGQRSVEYDEIIGIHHPVVLFENSRLKETETFRAIVGKR